MEEGEKKRRNLSQLSLEAVTAAHYELLQAACFGFDKCITGQEGEKGGCCGEEVLAAAAGNNKHTTGLARLWSISNVIKYVEVVDGSSSSILKGKGGFYIYSGIVFIKCCRQVWISRGFEWIFKSCPTQSFCTINCIFPKNAFHHNQIWYQYNTVIYMYISVFRYNR